MRRPWAARRSAKTRPSTIASYPRASWRLYSANWPADTRRLYSAAFNRLVSAGQLARARALLAHLAATRENYIMVDDDFQLPVVAARYLADPRGDDGQLEIEIGRAHV